MPTKATLRKDPAEISAVAALFVLDRIHCIQRVPDQVPILVVVVGDEIHNGLQSTAGDKHLEATGARVAEPGNEGASLYPQVAGKLGPSKLDNPWDQADHAEKLLEVMIPFCNNLVHHFQDLPEQHRVCDLKHFHDGNHPMLDDQLLDAVFAAAPLQQGRQISRATAFLQTHVRALGPHARLLHALLQQFCEPLAHPNKDSRLLCRSKFYRTPSSFLCFCKG